MQLTKRVHDDRGSLVIALSVIMVLGMLGVAVAYRTDGAVRNSARDQNFNLALANADAGINDALFQLDQMGNDPEEFCVGVDDTCYLDELAGAPGVKYRASRVSDNEFTVISEGLVNGVPHAAEALFERDVFYPFAIFGKDHVTFNGKGTYAVDATNEDGTPDPESEAFVGSNGDITCNSGKGVGDGQVSFPDGGNKGCPGWEEGEGSYDPQDPVEGCPAGDDATPTTPCFAASLTEVCPDGGDGVLDSPITPGVYVCRKSVTVRGTLTVANSSENSGRVELFVMPPLTGGPVDLVLAGPAFGSVVNPATAPDTPDPKKFQVFMAGEGNVVMGNGINTTNFTGTIYAPSADVSDSCQFTITGAIVVGSFTCNGTPNMTVNYTSALNGLLQEGWHISNYTPRASGAL